MAERYPLQAFEDAVELMDIETATRMMYKVPKHEREARFWTAEAKRQILCAAKTAYPHLPLIAAVEKVQREQ